MYLVVDARLPASELVLIDVRATVHSLLAQAGYVGVIVCGLGVAAVARLAGQPLAFATCGALLLITIVLVQRAGPRRSAAADRG